MSRDERERNEVLNDSEATLRQVADILADFDSPDPDRAATSAEDLVARLEESPEVLATMAGVLVRAYGEIRGLADVLRRNQSLLHPVALRRLHATRERLAEVSFATESATRQILDGLDRSLRLVDQLEEADDGGSPPGAGDEPPPGTEAPPPAAIREEMRDELHGLVTLLQFQDITSQQLGYASGVLSEIQGRLQGLIEMFEVADLGLGPERHPDLLAHESETCDPKASTRDPGNRQAVADEIFT